MIDQTSLTLPPRFLIFGLECQFTLAAIKQLLDEYALPPTAVVLPGPPNYAGVLTSPFNVMLATTDTTTVAGLCRQERIPLLRTGDLSATETQAQLTRYDANFALIACFNRLIPAELIAQFPHSVFNLHPSLLPLLRGPDPMFWTLKRGDGQAGITVHQVTGKFDAGPILAQEQIRIVDGATESDIERKLAARGIDLVTSRLQDILSGAPRLSPQDHRLSTWAPFPDLDDFEIDMRTAPQSAFNFVRGIQSRPPGAWYERHGTRYIAVDAIEYGEGDPPAVGLARDEHILKTEGGWIRVKYRPA